MNKLSEYFSEDEKRRAEIHFSSGDEQFEVFLYEDGKVVELKVVDNHTLQYCEDLAENWVQYVGAFK